MEQLHIIDVLCHYGRDCVGSADSLNARAGRLREGYNYARGRISSRLRNPK